MDKLKCTNPKCSSTTFCMMEVAPKKAEGQYFRAVTCTDCDTVYGIVEYENIGELVKYGTQLNAGKLNTLDKKMGIVLKTINDIKTKIGRIKK